MKYRSSLLALLFLSIIPALGYFISNGIINDLNSKSEFSVIEVCFSSLGNSSKELKEACDEIKRIHYLEIASIASGLGAIGLLVFYVLVSVICGSNRGLISIIFPILVPISTFLVAVLILVQGVILTYGAYIAESYFTGRVHYFLIGGIGIGAFIASLKLLSSLFSLRSKPEFPVFGTLLMQKDNEVIWSFVKSIASDLNARIPDNIIVGLEPTFFATSANVKIINDNKVVSGETLFLSVVLMRLFTKSELKSVIGHELGHFIGSDTKYTMRFAPIYSGLNKSIKSIDEEEGFASLVSIPAIAMLSAMIEIFAINVSKISRTREFEADMAGVKVSSGEDLGIALGKVATFAHFWQKVRQENIERLNDGKISGNLSEVFVDSSKYDLSITEVGTILTEILNAKITHPTDTHPAISDRYKNIGFDPEKLTIKKISSLGNIIDELLPQSREIEKNLTLFEHRFLIALGVVSVPENNDTGRSNFLNTIYTLAASMIGADGKIEQNEMRIAEQIGKKLFSNFDGVDFRTVCKNLDTLPNFKDLIDLLEPIIDVDIKTALYNYLKDIANSDDELAQEEEELLQLIRRKWNLKI